MRILRIHAAASCLALLAAVALAATPRAIPGITAPDQFPNGCVSCHIRLPDGRDMRLSTLVAKWNGKVDAKQLAAMQALAPKGVTLKGKHPPITAGLKDIPASCIKCHGQASKIAPSLARMAHAAHLAPGGQKEFLSKFGGECTHCHKLNKTTAVWTLPSGPEK
jgi:hypothetical protein